ncbi:MAG: hypothetical protein KHY37_04260 [Actinomyces graevenitzii]|jgi:hypothetical protein|nr:hypothetical protein [Actinomyces graevenitzii]
MKESFGDALGNAIVKNLAKNADVDPKKIAVGLVVTVAGTALTVVTKSVTQKIVVNAIRKANGQRPETENKTEDILELDDESSDEN